MPSFSVGAILANRTKTIDSVEYKSENPQDSAHLRFTPKGSSCIFIFRGLTQPEGVMREFRLSRGTAEPEGQPR
jgi:hypothetical protein